MKLIKKALGVLKGKAIRTIAEPLNGMVDDQITDIATTIGSFVIRAVRGKFQRSITFTIGTNYSDEWMEEALYGILYQYNNIKKGSKLELQNKRGYNDGSGMYYRLDDGTHNLKYRNYNILLFIQTKTSQSASGRFGNIREYTIITYDLDPIFVTTFEKDMLEHRNALLKINKNSPTIQVWKDCHEGDGETYWEKVADIPKRKLNTIYIPMEQKRQLVDTVNTFMSSRKFYEEHGVPWTLKILLYGPPSSGKSSIVKMIASEWNRNIFECMGGKNGKFMPEAISDTNDKMVAPLFSISDIDKYPALINEPEVNIENGETKEEQLLQKQIFNNMINALDGIATAEGRIIVMTTNHIEKFSETFLRPGRIDLKMEIGYVTPEVFRRYFKDNYDVILPKDIELVDEKTTIAKMQFDMMFGKLSAEEFVAKYVKNFAL